MLDASPVRLQLNACVQLRSRYAECGHCEKNCPSGALRIHDGRMDVGEGCIGCGRCLAACPTGALEVHGFPSRLGIDPNSGRPLTVDCERAPAGADIRVPCLGGLSVSRLLALRLAAEQRPIHLVDHGWCAICPAGAGTKEHPAAKSLARAAVRLSDAGLAEALMPRLERAAVAARPMRAPSRPQPGRRRFVMPFDSSPKAIEPRFTPAPAPDRVLTLELLTRLSTQYGGEISEKLYHRVAVDARCQGRGVCAAGCPTGALRLERDAADGASLSHASQLCIACGQCERACPEKALRLERGAGYAPRREIARFETRECKVCGTQLRGRFGSEKAMCLTCEKSSALARSAFHQFYKQGAGAGS